MSYPDQDSARFEQARATLGEILQGKAPRPLVMRWLEFMGTKKPAWSTHTVNIREGQNWYDSTAEITGHLIAVSDGRLMSMNFVDVPNGWEVDASTVAISVRRVSDIVAVTSSGPWTGGSNVPRVPEQSVALVFTHGEPVKVPLQSGDSIAKLLEVVRF